MLGIHINNREGGIAISKIGARVRMRIGRRGAVYRSKLIDSGRYRYDRGDSDVDTSMGCTSSARLAKEIACNY